MNLSMESCHLLINSTSLGQSIMMLWGPLLISHAISLGIKLLRIWLRNCWIKMWRRGAWVDLRLLRVVRFSKGLIGLICMKGQWCRLLCLGSLETRALILRNIDKCKDILWYNIYRIRIQEANIRKDIASNFTLGPITKYYEAGRQNL